MNIYNSDERNYIKACLKLFNAIPIDNIENLDFKVNENILERTLKHGYIINNSIIASDKLLDVIESVIGISGEKANSTFHKSWQIIKNTPDEILRIQQIIHYITTYGFQQLGIFKESTVYIPNEILQIPDITEELPIIIIRSIKNKSIYKNIINLVSEIALSEETLNNIMVIIKYNKYSIDIMKNIKNKELKSLLNNYYNIIPQEPLDFLKYLILKLTGETLLIKNDYLINKIKESDFSLLDSLILKAPSNLASIFYRYKPLFLAMKSISQNKNFFNKLRKKAIKIHTPFEDDFLNQITKMLKHKISINENNLNYALSKANIFRKIRLLNALQEKLYIKNVSKIYKIRNGKIWIKDKINDISNIKNNLIKIKTIIYESILNDLNVKNKIFYIPKYIKYNLPSSEKQFLGNIPVGSYIDVPYSMIAGIHWYNNNYSVDLDLSLIDNKSKIGWDEDYKTSKGTILFSGDITTAPKPKGASELFYIQNTTPKIMMINYYNYNVNSNVKTKIFIGQDKKENINKNYVFDVNKMFVLTDIIINKKQYIIGMIETINNKNRFYFINYEFGKSNSCKCNKYLKNIILELNHKYKNIISLNQILEDAGSKIIHKKTKDDFIDLSPETLNKNTIIDILQNSGQKG